MFEQETDYSKWVTDFIKGCIRGETRSLFTFLVSTAQIESLKRCLCFQFIHHDTIKMTTDLTRLLQTASDTDVPISLLSDQWFMSGVFINLCLWKDLVTHNTKASYFLTSSKTELISRFLKMAQESTSAFLTEHLVRFASAWRLWIGDALVLSDPRFLMNC